MIIVCAWVWQQPVLHTIRLELHEESEKNETD